MVVTERPSHIPEPTERCNGINAGKDLPLWRLQRFKGVFVVA